MNKTIPFFIDIQIEIIKKENFLIKEKTFSSFPTIVKNIKYPNLLISLKNIKDLKDYIEYKLIGISNFDIYSYEIENKIILFNDLTDFINLIDVNENILNPLGIGIFYFSDNFPTQKNLKEFDEIPSPFSINTVNLYFKEEIFNDIDEITLFFLNSIFYPLPSIFKPFFNNLNLNINKFYFINLIKNNKIINSNENWIEFNTSIGQIINIIDNNFNIKFIAHKNKFFIYKLSSNMKIN